MVKSAVVTYYIAGDDVERSLIKIIIRPTFTFCCDNLYGQESTAVADKPARRLRKVCTVYVRAVGL